MNTQIYKRPLWNGSHRMVSSVYLFFACGFIGNMGHTNVQMRKCTNRCSRLNKSSASLIEITHLCDGRRTIV